MTFSFQILPPPFLNQALEVEQTQVPLFFQFEKVKVLEISNLVFRWLKSVGFDYMKSTSLGQNN